MKALLLILSISIIYALIRAKHDSFISGGPWKKYAFIEGVLVAIVSVVAVVSLFGLNWWIGFPLGALFAFVFWLFFDCIVGWHFSGSILYIGNTGFDKLMRETFKYNLPIFGWKSGALILIIFKSFWIALLILIYNALL